MYSACVTSFSFNFDRLYPMTDMSSGDGKIVIFSVLLALSCRMNDFVQEELFTLTIFTLQGNLRQKSRPPWRHLNIATIRWHYI